MKSNAFTLKEVDSIYIDPKDRFVVSLVVGYAHGEVKDAKTAAYAALSLTRDENQDDTIWFVHDRQTGETHQFEQSDFSEVV